MNIYLETGTKKTFACAADWPGWSRSGRDEDQALQALLDSAPRYARIVQPAALGFAPPTDVKAFEIIERLAGGVNTDFGTPGVIPAIDGQSVDSPTRARFHALLEAYWAAFDAARQAARGKTLRKGPRGGGRDLVGIIDHTLQADLSYLAQIGWQVDRKALANESPEEQLKQTRAAIRDAFDAAIRGELPTRGPRGGLRWPPRYFMRRSGWHNIDHTWEIEDRILEA